jgi:Concanavalin A-like lectin/glucanases superfamily
MRGAKIVAIGVFWCIAGCFSLFTSTSDLAGPPLGADGEGGVDAGARPDAADPALVAYWPFDESAGIVVIDTSGHGHDGRLNAGATRTPGVLGGAIHFDRAAAGGVQATIVGFGLAGVTMAAWVKSTDTASSQSRVCGAGFETSYMFVNFNQGLPFLEAQTQRAYWGAGSRVTPVADDQWHHLASVVDRSRQEIRFFVDGALAGVAPPAVKDAGADADDTFGNPAKSYEFVIGSESTNPALEFGGTIDEVRVYSRALDENEVASLARRP